MNLLKEFQEKMYGNAIGISYLLNPEEYMLDEQIIKAEDALFSSTSPGVIINKDI
jgi:hypothetical protein